MAVPEDSPASTTRWLFGLLRPESEEDVPGFVTAALGLIAAVLVGAGTLGAVQAGYAAVALGFLSAVALFLGTLVAFEAGRRFGADD